MMMSDTVIMRLRKLLLLNREQQGIIFSTHPLSVLTALLALTLTPLLFYGCIPTRDPLHLIKYIWSGWDGLFHFSSAHICALTIICTIIIVQQEKEEQSSGGGMPMTGTTTMAACSRRKINKRLVTTGLALVVTMIVTCAVFALLQEAVPSWMWNPFLWFRYEIYPPQDIAKHMEGMCLDHNKIGSSSSISGGMTRGGVGGRPSSSSAGHPLCLSQQSWTALSAGTLSSNNPSDVEAVLKGINYARGDEMGGLVINVMARDTVDSIQNFRANVEGLLPFFPNNNKLAVVVFENDSVDGSREAFQKWAKEVDDTSLYKVDVIECTEAPNCKFGIGNRYDSVTEEGDWFMSSAIGRMAEFRQRLVDYIIKEERYESFTHMLVMDVDLNVSISPLGLIASLGELPNEVVASSGREVWPGTLGTLILPYDFSSYRSMKTPQNQQLISLHKRFCNIMPKGTRWHNMCDALSSMQLMMVLVNERTSGSRPYQVASSFNGATIYPLHLIRETGSKYDAGDDGQQCEHVSFNRGLKRPMYVNPKWNYRLSPTMPGGARGWRAFNEMSHVSRHPQLSIPITLITLIPMCIFIFSIMVLVLHLMATCPNPLFACWMTKQHWLLRNNKKDLKKKKSDVSTVAVVVGDGEDDVDEETTSSFSISFLRSRKTRGGRSAV